MSESVAVLLTDGEYVINAAAARKHIEALRRLNGG